jgi:hypothetical protein
MIDYNVTMNLYADPIPTTTSRADYWFTRRSKSWSVIVPAVDMSPITGDGGLDIAKTLNARVAQDCIDKLRDDFDLSPSDIPAVDAFEPKVWTQTGGGHEGDAVVSLTYKQPWSKLISGQVYTIYIHTIIQDPPSIQSRGKKTYLKHTSNRKTSKPGRGLIASRSNREKKTKQ